MRTLKELRDPRINGDMARPELVIHPRLDLAAQLGVTVASISETVRVATLGEIAQNEAKFSLADRQIPIRVSLVESARSNLATLENLPVRTASGATVPLKAVADIGFGQGPSKIRRYNQQRRLSLEADLNHTELGPAMKKIRALPIYKNLPHRRADRRRRARRSTCRSCSPASCWRSSRASCWCSPCWCCCSRGCSSRSRSCPRCRCRSAAPCSPWSSPAARSRSGTVLGILMLMGLVAKNSILLVEFAIEEMRAGKDRLTALLEAGHKRARPIVMTSVAMIAGMLPLALGVAGDAALQGQMAIAVIGGLITSTALTLVMVPAGFTWMDDLERWLGRKFGHRLVNEAATRATPPGARPAAGQAEAAPSV